MAWTAEEYVLLEDRHPRALKKMLAMECPRPHCAAHDDPRFQCTTPNGTVYGFHRERQRMAGVVDQLGNYLPEDAFGEMALRAEGDPNEYLPDGIMIKTYGPEYIIVYKPRQVSPDGVDYFITESHNLPARTRKILEDIVLRMHKNDLRTEG